MKAQNNYNSILCAPTLLCEPSSHFSGNPLGLDISMLYGLLCNNNQSETKTIDASNFANTLEFYVRTMLCSCAQTISIPAYGKDMWATPKKIQRLVSKSIGKRLKFVDRNNAYWKAVETYLRPISNDLILGFSKELFEKTCSRKLEDVAWDVYLLLLAVQGHSEVPIDPEHTVQLVNWLSKQRCLSAESRARLAIIRGLFGLFKKSEELPSFRCTLSNQSSLKERLDEIMDDAYLLDASRLRSFFGLQSNLRAIKADLKKLTKFIAKNRPWAKGVIMASSQASLVAASTNEAIDKLVELFPECISNAASPVLIAPNSFRDGLGDVFVITSRRRPFDCGGENWAVECRKNYPQVSKRLTMEILVKNEID